MMKEMLSRRFRKKYENAKTNVLSNIPELIIVDGGKAVSYTHLTLPTILLV